jgi:hypothetical protein
MRTARAILIFTAIVALIALTMSPAADLVPFDVLSPVWFVFAAIVIAMRERIAEIRRPLNDPFVPATALRAPPLQ